MQRSNTWRSRLDNTTYWAVLTVAGALSFAFSSPNNPHFVIPINSILVAIFLLMEARRYRYYEIWSSRVRILETGYFANILTPENRPADEAWAEHLAADLTTPHFTITEWEAVGRRLRRVRLDHPLAKHGPQLGPRRLVDVVVGIQPDEGLGRFPGRAIFLLQQQEDQWPTARIVRKRGLEQVRDGEGEDASDPGGPPDQGDAQCRVIGRTSAPASVDIATSGVTVGGATQAARNLISGNNQAGVAFASPVASNNVVEGSPEHVRVSKQDHRGARGPPASGSEAEIDVPETDQDERNRENAQVVTEKRHIDPSAGPSRDGLPRHTCARRAVARDRRNMEWWRG